MKNHFSGIISRLGQFRKTHKSEGKPIEIIQTNKNWRGKKKEWEGGADHSWNNIKWSNSVTGLPGEEKQQAKRIIWKEWQRIFQTSQKPTINPKSSESPNQDT